MALQPAICTNCGGNIKVDDIDLNGFGKCDYCKTPYKVIDIITIEGLPTAKSLLTAADHSMEDGNLDKAVGLFNEIIKIKPNCHEAWWGLYICNSAFDGYYGYEDKYGNSGPNVKARIMTTTLNKYALRAIDYAPKDMAEQYRKKISETIDFIESVKHGVYDNSPTKKENGCYIATAVYGSYTCDEVVKLRKFRDDKLAKHTLGRYFIRFYYIVGPCLAKQITPKSKIGRLTHYLLDKILLLV